MRGIKARPVTWRAMGLADIARRDVASNSCQALNIERQTATLFYTDSSEEVAPGRYCSPRHDMTFN
jgi:hypothetical protein